MLKKFIENPGFKKIPHTGGMYEISCSGIARESISKRVLTTMVSDEGEHLFPEHTTGEWFDGLALSVVLGVTYRNCILPMQLLHKLRVIYKDGNKSNHRLTNFIWACPEGELTHPLIKEYCYIPGYSRYMINRAGQVLSTVSSNHLSPYMNEDGYLMYGVQPDVGKRTIVGMHRLLSLAFLKYPGNVDSLDVNHLNTIKDCNDLTNLEWATRKRNCEHAHINGLHNSKAVLVRDLITTNITRYYSIEQCAREIGIDGETLRLRLTKNSNLVYNQSLQFKYEDDDTPWNNDNLMYVETHRRIHIESLESEAVLIKNSLKEAAEFFNVTPGCLGYHLRKSEHGCIFRNYAVKYISPHIPK
ncbi:hypothetical protein [Pseudomonas phage U1B]|nr:hypothetical protein [Pseudomonas phage T2P]QYV99376.1 hypothetical protein [Pseudomonas phage U1B]QYV99832.1 hypothetical protein [Pseudomonas phage U5]